MHEFGKLLGGDRFTFRETFGADADWRVIGPEIRQKYPSPRYMAGAVRPSREDAFYGGVLTAAEAGTLVLRNAFLYDCGLAIKDGFILLDPTITVPAVDLGAWGWYSRVKNVSDNTYSIDGPTFSDRRLKRAVTLLRRGYHTHGHWILEILPRALAAKGLLNDPDTAFIIGPQTPKYHIEMLEALGLSKDRLFSLPENEAIFCEELWMPSVAHANQLWIHPYANETYDLLIEKVGGDPDRNKAPDGCIFVTRGSRDSDPRPLLNSDELEQIAVSCGFKVVDPGVCTWQDQIRLFANAGKIIGLCGSGLHNTVFAKRYAHVCVLQPNQNFNFLQTSIAAIRGHDISYLIGDSFSGFDKNTWESSYLIDPYLFRLFLEALL